MGFVKIATYRIRPEAVLYVAEGDIGFQPDEEVTATIVLETKEGLQSLVVTGPSADEITEMIEAAERPNVRPFARGTGVRRPRDPEEAQ